MPINSGINLLKEEKGYVLGMVLIFFLIFSIIGLSILEMAGDERVFAARYSHKVQAFYNAEAGINRGIWLANKVSLSAATFSNSTVNVVYDSTTKIMTATGTSGQNERIVRVTLQGSGGEDIWPYVLYSDTQGIEFTKGDGEIKGDIHSNTSITISGHDVDGDQTVAPPAVDVPTVDWDYYKQAAIAQGKYRTGYLILNTSYETGDGIWYCEGPIYMWNYEGLEGTLVSRNSVYLFGSKNTIEAPDSLPAIIAERLIYFMGNEIQIEGSIFNLGTNPVYMQTLINCQKLELDGSIITKGLIRKNSNNSETNIKYKKKYVEDIMGIDYQFESGDLQIFTWSEIK